MDILQQIVDIFHSILGLLGHAINVFEGLITLVINLMNRLGTLGITG